MRRPEQILDELLVLECQNGDRAALELLVERWQPRLLRLARRLTQGDEAGEAVQEAWLAIVRGLGRLEDPARFGTWAYRIVAFKCADWIRQRQRGRRMEQRVTAQPQPVASKIGVAETGADETGAEGDIAALRVALRRLAPSHRAILEMHYLDELPVAEIAAVLGIPIGTVKSRLFHARKRLRATLEEAS
ncbi:MAG: sigma-70 family RNA polymerase sigma factor [Acidobacteria bacterium]|nr:sigma-70 family RNA polymerase sigma factor [Acidobacteriota bacterium]